MRKVGNSMAVIIPKSLLRDLGVAVGDPVEITANASDPDNDPLTFSWSASGGRLEGTGTTVRFHTRDVSPGAYTITADGFNTGQINKPTCRMYTPTPDTEQATVAMGQIASASVRYTSAPCGA